MLMHKIIKIEKKEFSGVNNQSSLIICIAMSGSLKQRLGDGSTSHF